MTNLIKTKAYKLLFILSVFLLSQSAFALKVGQGKDVEKNVSLLVAKEIKTKLMYPLNLIDENIKERVKIEFIVNDDFTIKPLTIECNNALLKRSVTNQLSEIVLSNNAESLVNKKCEITVLFMNTNF